MGSVLTEIVGILTGGITGVASGIGSGLSTLATSIFLEPVADGGTPTLSVFGGLVVVFAGIGLAIGLSRWVVNWVTSLGASN